MVLSDRDSVRSMVGSALGGIFSLKLVGTMVCKSVTYSALHKSVPMRGIWPTRSTKTTQSVFNKKIKRKLRALSSDIK